MSLLQPESKNYPVHVTAVLPVFGRLSALIIILSFGIVIVGCIKTLQQV